MLTYGSLFAGVGGFDQGLDRSGMECRWQVEWDKNCQTLLQRKWPNAKHYEDIRDVKSADLEDVDVICGGSPCQGFSIAGLRGGLNDDRSNLMLQFVRVVAEKKPNVVVWENVPGALSDSTDAVHCLLDALDELGYVYDMDILDAQYFGVPQRRRRIFVCAQSLTYLLKQRTISSALITAQCVAELLALNLAALSGRSNLDSESWTFDASNPALSLQKRMQSFSLGNPEVVSILAENLDDHLPLCGCGPEDSESRRGTISPPSTGSPIIERSVGRDSGPTDAQSRSTATSWKKALADLLPIVNACITSTVAKETTESAIYSCATTALRISESITLSGHSSPPYWSAAYSALTALKAFTNYARQSSEDLFGDATWVRVWHDFIGEAVPVCDALGSIGVGNFEKILPVSESLRGDSPPSRGARERVAGSISARTEGGGGLGTDFEIGGGAVRVL